MINLALTKVEVRFQLQIQEERHGIFVVNASAQIDDRADSDDVSR